MYQALTGFNSIAERYDDVWTNTAVGVQQRFAVWRRIDSLFSKSDRVLDLGCGTGIDAHHLQMRGVEVYGIDGSEAMVQKAQSRGVNAHHLAIENLQCVQSVFDGAISNFGALNCVRSLEVIAHRLARCIRPNGYLALCLMGRCCFWEAAYFVMRGEFRKAFRRFAGVTVCSFGVEVCYPTKTDVLAAFSPYFLLAEMVGIGLFVPPSYVRVLSQSAIARLAAIDSRLAGWPLLRSLSDHRLYVFQRYGNHS